MSKVRWNKRYQGNYTERKRNGSERVLHGTFTPLVFAANGAMMKECVNVL